MRCAFTPLFLLICLALLAGCAGNTYAPVSDRTGGGGGSGSAEGVHEVVRGDSLYSIAFRHGLDHRDLATWNEIKPPHTIYPGQRIRLSPPGGRTASRQPDATPASGRRREPVSPSTESAGAETAPNKPAPAGRSSAPARAQTSVDWLWPVGGEVLKQFSKDGDGKQGINIGGSEGEDVKAAAPGRVVYSGSGLAGYGNLVILMHDNDYLTAYGYNRELLVEEGADVRRGQTIGRMGRSGNTPMLHFELRRDGRPVDPLGYLPRRP